MDNGAQRAGFGLGKTYKVNRHGEVSKGKMGVERKMKGLLSESVNANTKFLWLIQLTCLLVQRLLLKQLTPECFVL